MTKLMVFLSRRPDLDTEEFDRHLYGPHAALVRRLPGLRRLVLNQVLPDPTGAPRTWDAIAEDWFDTPEAMQVALASPEGQAVNADAPSFLDLSKLAVVVVREHEVALPSMPSQRELATVR